MSDTTGSSPPCDACSHTAWAHDERSGQPTAADPCHAAGKPEGEDKCPCASYQPGPILSMAGSDDR